VVLSFVGVAPANAECHTWYDANGQVHVDCEQGGGDSTDPGGGGGGIEWDGRGTETHMIPACMQSSIGQNEDVMCMGATMCPDKGDLRMRIFTRPTLFGEPTGDWELQATRCVGPEEAAATEQPVITREMVVGEAERLAPKPQAHIEPGTWSMVNLPNNYYVDAQPVTRQVVVLGRTISITFTPTEHTWDFGDGQSATGDGIEGAEVAQPGAVEHAYSRQGSYDVTVARGYDLRFALPGGQVNVPNAFTITSPVATLPVREMQTRVDSVG
jgi:hypothetical protein